MRKKTIGGAVVRKICVPSAGLVLLASIGCSAPERNFGSVDAGGTAGSLHTGGVSGALGGAGDAGASGHGGVSGAAGASGNGGTAGDAGGSAAEGGAGGVSGHGGIGAAGESGSSGAGGNAGEGGMSGAGGLPGGAGASGSGGIPGCESVVTALGNEPLIDNLNDGNATLPAYEGRSGAWWISKDSQIVLGPGQTVGEAKPVAGGTTGFALRLSSSSTQAQWGADVSAVFVGVRKCYDASKYEGLTFSLKGTGTVRVMVLSAALRDNYEGGHDYFVFNLDGGDWVTYEGRWAELKRGWGTPPIFDSRAIYGVSFAAEPPFDFWVDDIAFLK